MRLTPAVNLQSSTGSDFFKKVKIVKADDYDEKTEKFYQRANEPYRQDTPQVDHKDSGSWIKATIHRDLMAQKEKSESDLGSGKENNSDNENRFTMG